MIPSGDLRLQYESIRAELDQAVQGVFDSGWFILGKNVAAFEEEFAAYCGARYAIGVGNGTDALQLALMACDIGPGDEVITAPNSAVFTALAISATGARPTFVDIDPDSFNLDPQHLEAAIGPHTKAIMPVHLFGQCADMRSIVEIAQRHGLYVIEDAAQAHGARMGDRRAGALGDMGCFSFYPSKNLGAFGDGGMVTTNDAALAERLRMLRNGGQRKRYEHLMLGRNSRLDELQAAILRVKLAHLDDWNARRRAIAAQYDMLLRDCGVACPSQMSGMTHVYHLYVIRTRNRTSLQQYLGAHGVETAIHYPTPIHLQVAYESLGLGQGTFPIAEQYAGEIVSLPIYPELTDQQVQQIATLIGEWHHQETK